MSLAFGFTARAQGQARQTKVNAAYGQLPLAFEINQGQSDPRVKFLCRGAGYGLFLTGSDTVLALARPAPRENVSATKGVKGAPAIRVSNDVLSLKLLGAKARPQVEGMQPLLGKSNYFIGNNPKQWRSNIPQYARVKSAQIYPGIDLVYYGRQRELEYDFEVASGADPSAIRFTMQGARKMSLNPRGDLVLQTPGGDVIEQAPLIYQEVDGRRKPISGGYELRSVAKADSNTGNNLTVGFRITSYDHSKPLIIDPVLTYSTYLGGNGYDYGQGIALDGSGDAYITGYTQSTDFPSTSGAFQTALGGSTENAFVTELNASGTAVVYSTYLGGSSSDIAYGIATDGSGNAYVTGVTQSADFPTTAGAFQVTYGAYGNAFVTKLNATGSALVYSTYLGASGGGAAGDRGNGIAVDGSGNVYIAGQTGSLNFPTTAGAFQTTMGVAQAAFVTKLNATGTALVYSTYLAGNYHTAGEGIAVDGSGNAYVTGGTAFGFPTTTGAFQTSLPGSSGGNAFVTKLNSTGTALIYSTYLGGSAIDDGTGIALDGSGNAYIAGDAHSSDFPTSTGAYKTIFGVTTSINGFVTKLNATGTALVYSSYLGGSTFDLANGIAVDGSGNAYVTGEAQSPDFPTTTGAFQTTRGSALGYNAFLTKLNATGTGLVYSTYLGGNNADMGNAIAVDGFGTAYITGNTDSSNFPTTPRAIQSALAGPQNAFVAQISTDTILVTPNAGPGGTINPSTPQLVNNGGSISFIATPASGYAVEQWLVNGTPVQTGGTNYTLAGVTANTAVSVAFAPGGEFSFSVPSAVVHNTDGQVIVTVTRDFIGPASIGYETVDDSAVAGVDFIGTHGTLSFAANQTQATIIVPIIRRDNAPGATYFSIDLSNPSSYNTIGTPSGVGISILNEESFDSSLSQTTFAIPQSPPLAVGSITVNLSPAAADGQWRLFGELNWRNSGVTVTGLTSGNYEIDFKPVDGYQQPNQQDVPLLSGSDALLSGTYTLNGSPATGSLQVNLEPQGAGGWRFQGESAWRSSGDTVANLNTGDYILEFEPVTGLATPSNCEAVVYAGQLATATITYLVADSTIGRTPIMVSDAVAQTSAPFVFTGQIQTDEGLGSGFVPMDRVVLTAAHVLFDDSTLSYAQGVRWFFQYETGVFESPAHIPAGSYILSGYAAQRASDIAGGVSPGVATTASRELDAAALYFFEPVARGGQSGYLGSNSSDNPWLTGSQDKFIAGYPVTGVTAPGRLYATPIVEAPFQYVTGSLFSTTAITSFSGNSGGPLFVRYSNGHYYPAAIYLGGSGDTVVHAIDSDVIALMNKAEVSGNGGANNSGGGIIQVNEGVSGLTAFALGSVAVTLSPPGAVSAGAYWEIGDGVKRFNGQSVTGLTPGSYTVQSFTGGPGYSAPAPAAVSVTAGNETDVTATYTPNRPTITSGTEAAVTEGQSFSYQIAVTPGATGYAVTGGAPPSGLTLDATSGLISGVVSVGAATGEFPVSLQATNNQGSGTIFPLTLKVVLSGQLTVNISGKGTVPRAFVHPSIQAVGSSISITATPAAGYLFAYWSNADTSAVLSTQETYAFGMPALLDLQANFVLNPFPTSAGSYLALLQGSSFADSGFAQMTITASGRFTSTYTLGGTSATVTNAFNNQGQYQGDFEIPGVALFHETLSLSAGGLLSGTLVDQADGARIQLNAERTAPRADQAVAGVYTGLLPALSGTAFPGGNGYGSLTVSATGVVKFTGKLGDGLPATLSGSLDGNGVWPFLFFKPAGATAGAELLLGSVAFPPAASGTAGTLTWYRAANANDPVYPSGFSTTIPFLAGRYSPPVVNYSSASVTFSAEDITTPIVEPITISPGDVVTTTGPTPFTLKFTAATGQFTGAFPDNGTPRTFAGALLQSGSTGLGLFQEPSGQTGSVLLQATP